MAKPARPKKPSKPGLNIAQELGVLMMGDSIEVLVDELVDPGSRYTPGQRARLAATMIAVGTRMEEDLKEEFAGVVQDVDCDVIFNWKNPFTSTRVNTDEVKAQYPQESHPSLYYESETKGSVGIELPFVKSRLDLPEYGSSGDGASKSEPVAVAAATPAPQEQMDFPDLLPSEPF